MDEGALIAIVESYSIIYDKSRSDFKDINKKHNAWMSVAETMGQTIDECQRVWKKIREKYSRELKMVKNVPSGSSPHSSEWVYFDSLSFLEKHVRGRKTTSNLQIKNVKAVENRPGSSTPDLTLDSFNFSPSQDYIIPENSQNFSEQASDLASSTPLTSPVYKVVVEDTNVEETPKKKKKKKMLAATDDLDDVVGATLGNVSKYIAEKSKMDSSTAFGNYVGLALKEMPEDIRKGKQNEIMKILND